MKGKDTMRKSNWWFAAALIAIIALTIGLPVLTSFSYDSIQQGRLSFKGDVSDAAKASMAAIALTVLMLPLLVVMVRTRMLIWVLAAAMAFEAGFLYSWLPSFSSEAEAVNNGVRIAVVMWLVGVLLTVTYLLFIRRESKQNMQGQQEVTD